MVNTSLLWFLKAAIPLHRQTWSELSGNSKIPDFYWAYIDPLVDDPDDASKQFVVECKRLTNPSVHYMREYVDSGIARFINLGHGYGMGMKSGAIAGYLQDVLLDDALVRVNDVVQGNAIPSLVQTHRRGERGAEFEHIVVRSFPESPFRLIHIWGRIGPEPRLVAGPTDACARWAPDEDQMGVLAIDGWTYGKSN